MFEKIWNDAVWSKVIAYGIAGFLAFIGSISYTYFFTYEKSEENSFASLIFSTNVDVSFNLFTLLTACTFFALVIMVFVYRKHVFKYDVFLSAPMSGFENEEEYQSFRKECLEIKKKLEAECGYKKIYFAGDTKENISNFSVPKVAFNQDLKALKNSKRFILVHPKKMQTSTIFEAGYAYRKGTESVYFVEKATELPFLMRHLNDVSSSVSTICVSDMKKVKDAIETDNNHIFSHS